MNASRGHVPGRPLRDAGFKNHLVTHSRGNHMLINALKLIVAPRRAWQALADQDASAARVLLMHTIPLAVIPAVAWYFGVTRQGWDVAGQVVYLTPGSALPMCVLFYLAMIAGVLFLGYMVHWMAGTYESESRFSR